MRGSNHHRYFRNYWSVSRDILVVKENNKNKIFSAGYEIVPLQDNKALYIVSVAQVCQPKYTLEQISKALKTKCLPPSYKQYYGQTENGIEEALVKQLVKCGLGYIYFVDKLDRSIEYVHSSSIPKHKQINHPFLYTLSESDGSYVDYKTYPNKIISLSADKRDNPTKLYVNLNNRTFEIPLSKEGGIINQ